VRFLLWTPGSDASIVTELPMMNLLCRPAGVVLICSDCSSEWPVHEGQPFVSQLRLVALGHSCAARDEAAGVTDTGRPTHLHLVADP
jgi:hypothetical protein